MKKNSVFACSLALAFLASCSGAPAQGGEGEASSLPEASKEASPYGENNIVVHFYKAEKDYSRYALWLWKLGGQGKEYAFSGQDDYGAYALIPISSFTSDIASFKMGTIVKSAGSWSYQTPDLTADFSLAALDSSGNAPIWLKYQDNEIYYSEPSKLSFAKLEFDSLTSVYVSASSEFSLLRLKKNGETIKESRLNSPMKSMSWNLGEGFSLDFASSYALEAVFSGGESLEKAVSAAPLYDSKAFNAQYEYAGDDLGANYSKDRTLFKVWSPFAKKITLRLYSSGTPVSVSPSKGSDAHEDHPMSKGEKGVWSCSLEGDLEGKYYTYLVTNSLYNEQEIVDPNAKSAGINGKRGMIVDFSKTNPEGWDQVSPHPYDPKSLVVYETHVADVTSSPTWHGDEAKRKRYLGLSEEGTFYEEGGARTPTGFDYIKSLGVNAVQLQPIFDQDNDEANPSFNWGYNPLNYNVLEGSYSSDPYDGYARIKEFKEVVKSYSQAGINLIMDVVYNHVASVSGRSFDVLAPGYFFRYKEDGSLSNGSGCGNDTASERSMFSHFIANSVAFWAKEYKLGGFRFDLMGLQTLASMDEATETLRQINPSIAVYGEPWKMSTSTSAPLATQEGISHHMEEEGAPVYGAFNDAFRDGMIKGGMKGVGEVGFVTAKDPATLTVYGDVLSVREGIRGTGIGGNARIEDSNRTVNYVTCHDNYTLVDRFKEVEKASKKISYTEEELKRMNVLANAITFTSQGIAFFQEGEEFLRSKGGEHNSYGGQNDGRDYYAMNALDYSLALKNADMVEAYKSLIAFKTSFPGLRLEGKAASDLEIKGDSTNKNEIIYDLQDEEGNTYRVCHVNGVSSTPEKVDFEGFEPYLDTLGSGVAFSSATPVAPYQTLIGRRAN